MYVYVKNLITDLYDVGSFTPDGSWQAASNSSYIIPELAALKAHQLNGADVTGKFNRLMLLYGDLLAHSSGVSDVREVIKQ